MTDFVDRIKADNQSIDRRGKANMIPAESIKTKLSDAVFAQKKQRSNQEKSMR